MPASEHPFIRPLRSAFEKAADPGNALFQTAYMREQFMFFGIKTEERRSITKTYFRQVPMLSPEELHTVVKQLWLLPQREFQYAAQELIEHHKKSWDRDTILLIEYCITHKSWWDTVDYLSATLAGAWFRKFPADTKTIPAQWNRSADMWLNRSSLLFLLKYKKETDTAMLATYIKRLSGSKEFFIQKAIGWILREYSKTDPVWVKKFVEGNKLAALSVREGTKYI
jgi:3-methyladenine DNA glycosylase AlkD